MTTTERVRDFGRRASTWLDEAAAISEPGLGVTRWFLTSEHRALLDWLAEKSDALGFQGSLDACGNFVMQRRSARPDARTLIVGSHQDSVRCGGRYDGMLGIVVPLLAAAAVDDLPYHLEIIAFGDEEGGRFGTTLFGSRALAGTFDFDALRTLDREGISVVDAMTGFGLDPNGIDALARDPRQTLGFIEVHIEQGPILEAKHQPLGVVNAITSIERHEVVLTGRAGHAGTTPMEMREDALVAAAELVLEVNRMLRARDPLVGVVGQLEVHPNAPNVIPAEVRLTVELRSPQADMLNRARVELQEFVAQMPTASCRCIYQVDGVECDEGLTATLAAALTDLEIEPQRMFSGAGHDGLAMASLTPIAMLFVRCAEGLSHHPDEAIIEEDAGLAVEALRRALLRLGRQETQES